MSRSRQSKRFLNRKDLSAAFGLNQKLFKKRQYAGLDHVFARQVFLMLKNMIFCGLSCVSGGCGRSVPLQSINPGYADATIAASALF